MNNYVAELNLDFDPFVPGTPAKEFFSGGERQSLVEQIIELSLEGNMLAAVTGPLGIGKTSIAREVRRCFGDDAVCLLVTSSLFMNRAQFLEAVGKQLPKHKHISAAPNVEAGVERLRQLASELDLEAQSLILIVDDAHELSAEVLELIDDIVQRASKSAVRAILLGEKSLINLLQNTLAAESQANLAHFELEGLDIEDTLEYLRFKFASAGFHGPLPLSGGVVGEIQNAAAGIPAAINALASEALAAGNFSETIEDVADPDYVPAGKAFNFDANDHMQFDLDMDGGDGAASADDYVETDESDAQSTPRFTSRALSRIRAPGAVLADLNLPEFVTHYRYHMAASLLALAFFITLFVWTDGSAPDAAVRVADAAVATDSGTVNRVSLPVPVAAALPVDAGTTTPDSKPAQASGQIAAITDTAVAAASAPGIENTVVQTAPDPAVASASETAARVAPSAVPSAAPAVASPSTAGAASESTDLVASIPSVAAPKPAPVNTPKPAPGVKLSAFEQELLAYPANSFTIQILGSHSEANVQRFIAGKAVTEKHGYYETRHQNRPWFVVVAGNYRDRAAASAVIDRLPQSLRAMQPWIRSIGDIQRDIRQLHKL